MLHVFTIVILAFAALNTSEAYGLHRSIKLTRSLKKIPPSQKIDGFYCRSVGKIPKMNLQMHDYLTNACGSLLRVAGPILFLGMQLSTIQTALTIKKLKSVGKSSPLTFMTMLVNCVVWAAYGCLRQDSTVFWPNLSGIFVSIFCLHSFHLFSPAISQGWYAVISSTIIAAVVLLFTGNYALLGSIGCILSMCVTASPLAVLKTVLEEKSTRVMPFRTCVTMWINSFSWSLYGYLIAHDFNIYGPNSVSFILSSLQMALFAIYGSKKSIAANKSFSV